MSDDLRPFPDPDPADDGADRPDAPDEAFPPAEEETTWEAEMRDLGANIEDAAAAFQASPDAEEADGAEPGDEFDDAEGDGYAHGFPEEIPDEQHLHEELEELEHHASPYDDEELSPQVLARVTPISCAVITVADDETEETDRNGSLIRVKLMRQGHEVLFYRIVPDDDAILRLLMDELPGRVEVVIFNGGGDFGDDTTHQVVSDLVTTPLPGFGELLRMLAFQEVGPQAMLIQATAGLYKNMLVFVLPQRHHEVRRALDRLIVPQLRPMVWQHIRHLTMNVRR